jgi:hypothetical protein
MESWSVVDEKGRPREPGAAADLAHFIGLYKQYTHVASTQEWLEDYWARFFEEAERSPTDWDRANAAFARAETDGSLRGDPIIKAMGLAIRDPGARWRDATAGLDGQRVMACLEACSLDYGQYPDSLDELVPEYLPEMPVDPWNSKPFAYARHGDGFSLRTPRSSKGPGTDLADLEAKPPGPGGRSRGQ